MPTQRDDRVTPDDILALAEAGAQSGLLARNEQQVIGERVRTGQHHRAPAP